MSSFIAAGGFTPSRRQHPSVLHLHSKSPDSTVGDLIWASGDPRSHGFISRGMPDATTLPGEGPATSGRKQPSVGNPVPKPRRL